MSQAHQISTEPVRKMDLQQPLYRWACSCGQKGNGMHTSIQGAERSGQDHARAKEGER